MNLNQFHTQECFEVRYYCYLYKIKDNYYIKFNQYVKIMVLFDIIYITNLKDDLLKKILNINTMFRY